MLTLKHIMSFNNGGPNITINGDVGLEGSLMDLVENIDSAKVLALRALCLNALYNKHEFEDVSAVTQELVGEGSRFLDMEEVKVAWANAKFDKTYNGA